MTLDPTDCPICQAGECKGYPRLWRGLVEDPAGWMPIHESVNRLVGTRAAPQFPADLALREHLAQHGCCPPPPDVVD